MADTAKVVTKMATRDGFGKALVELGATSNFYVLSADLADATRTIYFRDAYPERYIECGIAEANMVGVAAGIATTGATALCSTFAMFAAGRAFEQIRNSVCYPNLHVVVAATHAGITVGEDGATHQCLEDISLMRSVPNMMVLNPCDVVETKKALKAALEATGPVYIRLGRMAVSVVTDENTPFQIGKANVLEDGNDAVLFATGIMVDEALKARAILAEQGIDLAVVNVHTIKPLDEQTVVEYARKTGNVFTAEEHFVIGGLGSAVSECLCKHYPTKVEVIGIDDQFGQSGTAGALMEHYKLTGKHIADLIAAKLGK